MATAGRFGLTAVRLAVAFAFALILVGSLTGGARAAEMDKGAFKQGCESGGHSFVDNPDGSFQCNLKSGDTIKCQDSTCIYVPKAMIVNTGGTVVKGGDLTVSDGTVSGGRTGGKIAVSRAAVVGKHVALIEAESTPTP